VADAGSCRSLRNDFIVEIEEAELVRNQSPDLFAARASGM
jgi:hypothetical protein